MKIGLKSIAICFAFANGYGMLKSCPDVKDAKWEALVIRQLKNLMKTRKDYWRAFEIFKKIGRSGGFNGRSIVRPFEPMIVKLNPNRGQRWPLKFAFIAEFNHDPPIIFNQKSKSQYGRWGCWIHLSVNVKPQMQT